MGRCIQGPSCDVKPAGYMEPLASGLPQTLIDGGHAPLPHGAALGTDFPVCMPFLFDLQAESSDLLLTFMDGFLWL